MAHRHIRELRRLLRRVRAQTGGAAPTREEVSEAQRVASGKRERERKRSLQLNQKCQGKTRCWCEACGPLTGDHTGYVHCFHCQCERMECELDPDAVKGKSSGWFF